MSKDQSLWSQIWKQELKTKTHLFYSFYDETAFLLEESIRVKMGMRILEPGCGSGRLSLALARKGAHVVLLDTSIEALKLAKGIFADADLAGKANFVLADIFHLPFLSESFDVVFNEGVVEHFVGSKRQIIISEMAKMVRNKGTVAILVPNAWNIAYVVYKAYYEKRHGNWCLGLEVPYNPRELKYRFSRAGLKVVREGGYRLIPIPYYSSFVPARLARGMLLLFGRAFRWCWLRLNTGYSVIHKNFALYIFCVGVKSSENGTKNS